MFSSFVTPISSNTVFIRLTALGAYLVCITETWLKERIADSGPPRAREARRAEHHG